MAAPSLTFVQVNAHMANDNKSRDALVEEAKALRARVAELEEQDSARRSTEAAITRAAREWQVTFDAIGEAVCVLDRDGHIQRCNRAMKDLLGREYLEIVGKVCWELIDCRSDSIANCPVARIWETGIREELEMPLLGRWFRVVADPIRDEEGHVTAVAHILSDVTEKKRMAEEQRRVEVRIQQAQKFESLNVMAASIAHSFNNLLTAVLGNIELAKLDVRGPSPVRECLDEAEQAAKRAAQLSKLMLTYVGKAEIHPKPIDMAVAVEEAALLLGSSSPSNVDLTFEFSPHPLTFLGDPAQIHQLVASLITNAIEAIGDGPGKITVRTGSQNCQGDSFPPPFDTDGLADGDYVFLEIADDGCGMDMDTLSKALDPFFTTKFIGRGLGLAAVLGIARAHRGAVAIDSKLNCGTSVKLFFPATQEPVEEAEAELPDAWRGSGTVLFVDDEPVVLSSGSALLQRLGFQVLTARDGQSAVTVFKAHADEIKCAILDVTMPGMDGAQTCQQLREIAPNLPVLFCSGHLEADVAQRLANLGPAPFVQKPFQMGAISRGLRKAMGNGGNAAE